MFGGKMNSGDSWTQAMTMEPHGSCALKEVDPRSSFIHSTNTL